MPNGVRIEIRACYYTKQNLSNGDYTLSSFTTVNGSVSSPEQSNNGVISVIFSPQEAMIQLTKH